MFPDIVSAVLKQVKVKTAIFEGEALSYDPETGECLPFQVTVKKKRKYDIAEKWCNIPYSFLYLICFMQMMKI